MRWPIWFGSISPRPLPPPPPCPPSSSPPNKRMRPQPMLPMFNNNNSLSNFNRSIIELHRPMFSFPAIGQCGCRPATPQRPHHPNRFGRRCRRRQSLGQHFAFPKFGNGRPNCRLNSKFVLRFDLSGRPFGRCKFDGASWKNEEYFEFISGQTLPPFLANNNPSSSSKIDTNKIKCDKFDIFKLYFFPLNLF